MAEGKIKISNWLTALKTPYNLNKIMSDGASTISSISRRYSDTMNNDTTIKVNVALGQLIAILTVVVGLMSQKIQVEFKIEAPLFLLASHFVFVFLISSLFASNSLKFRFIYIIMAITHSQANLLNIYAFRLLKFKFPYFISIMSLIFSLPLSLILVKHAKFKGFHYLGMFLCACGVALPLTDAILKHEFYLDTSKNSMIGLFVCISSAFLFALSTVLQENYLNSRQEIYDYFLFSSFINVCVCAGESWWFGEEKEIDFRTWGWEVYSCFIAFLVSLTLIQLVTPFYIKRFSAGMYNISVVSQIFWGGAYGIVFQEQEVFF